jgi:hypothetical protein
VSDWVQTALGRQIDDHDRRRLFVLAAVLVMTCALLLLAVRPDSSRKHVTVRPPITSATATAPRSLTRPPVRQPTTPRGVTRVASAFLDAYLPYLYGQPHPQLVAAATAALRRELAHQALVVPPAQSRLRPRVVSLTATRFLGRWQVRARIADGGVADYPIVLTLERAGDQWLVSGVSG